MAAGDASGELKDCVGKRLVVSKHFRLRPTQYDVTVRVTLLKISLSLLNYCQKTVDYQAGAHHERHKNG